MNLTDNEIIKALECCSKSNSNEEYCEDCPFKDTTGAYCIDLNIKAALDLIKRKDKALKLSAKEIVDLKIKVKQQKAEVERLNSSIMAVAEVVRVVEQELKTAKSTAIKEFAERLKAEFVQGVRVYNGYASVKDISRNIDNLVKEMEGK